MTDEAKTKPHYSWNETIRTILTALLLAVIFRSCAYEPFHIPSGSMKSNLLVGDYLFVSKYSYGYSRYSFPFGLPFFNGRIFGAEPKRGDVAVFRKPSNPRLDYIKRVIGLPGDTVQVRSGIIFINGTPLKRESIDIYTDDEPGSAGCLLPGARRGRAEDYVLFADSGLEDGQGHGQTFRTIPRLHETLPEGKIITILKECERGVADNTQLYLVPPGHYFMMGDNRDNSRDSRYLREVGYVPAENLVGRAEIIFFSIDGNGANWLNPLSWLSAMRLNRFFKVIE